MNMSNEQPLNEPRIASYFYLAAWIDLLGQRRLLEAAPVFPKNQLEQESLEKPFKNLDVFRDEVRKTHNTLNAAVKLPADKVLTPEQKAILGKFGGAEVKLNFISDAALLWVKLEERDDYYPLRSIHIVLQQLSSLMINLMAK